MKKILLVTLQGANIGNRLQNYALQEILKKSNCEVYTPYYDVPEFCCFSKRIKMHIKSIFAHLGIKKYIFLLERKKREKRFHEFDKERIDNRFKIRFGKVPNNYDFAISGSDQVWHKWSDDPNELDYFYLRFMPKSKRIAYAASFGFESFPQNDIQIHFTGLKEMNYLSCREEKGKKLIKDLVGRDALTVLDPTLLLTMDDWKKIQRKPKYNAVNYVLLYFLGNKNDEYKSAIEKLVIDNSLNIIDVFDTNTEHYLTTPDEFLWLVENAAFICTDSFHACVFSILFHKQFLAFRRNEKGMDGMFDRITTLFNHYNIDREFKGDISEIYKSYHPKDISDLKQESIDYLNKALELSV